MRHRAGKAIAVAALAATLAFTPGQAAAPAAIVISRIDLTRAFGTLSVWNLVATQEPDAPYADFGPMPGKVTLCLKRLSDRACSSAVRGMAKAPDAFYEASWQPHALDDARIVYPRGQTAPPLLLLQTASLPSAGDGETARFTQLVAYRPAGDRFEPVFSRLVFRNNNQEVRFIASGPLTGSVIIAEPTANAPFGYWVTVQQPDAAYRYRQVLRYRSATRYSDGNPMPVIDSEMPNIHRRLGLWRPGQRLPLPAQGCAKPRLEKMELWCS